MCEHTFESYDKRVQYLERTFIKPELASMVVDAEQRLAAAEAALAELKKDNERQKRLAKISRMCKEVQAFRAEKAEAALASERAAREQSEAQNKALEADCLKFQSRLWRAESQCAAMQEAFEQLSNTMTRIEKESFKSVCYDHVRQYVERILKPDFFKTAACVMSERMMCMETALQSIANSDINFSSKSDEAAHYKRVAMEAVE